jgi:hypothetical protein
MRLIAENMSEQQIPDNDIAHVKRHDGFPEPCVAGIGISVMPAHDFPAGFCIADPACIFCIFIAAQKLAEWRDFQRVGNQFVEIFIKYGDADFCDVVEIHQKRIEFRQIE